MVGQSKGNGRAILEKGKNKTKTKNLDTMNTEAVKSLINEHKDDILAFKTKSERLDCVISLLERTYHPVSLNDALTGPITDFVAAANHIEIQPVLSILRKLKTMDSDALVFVNNGGEDVEEVVKYIQGLIT